MTRRASRRSSTSILRVDRRAFLNWTTHGALALAMSPVLAACGGDSGSGPQPPASGGPEVSPERRQALLAALEKECHDQDRPGVSKTDYLAALVAFFEAQPECVSAGVDTDTLTAWAYLSDGSLHLVVENWNPSSVLEESLPRSEARRQVQAAAVTLPGTRFARAMHSFGPAFLQVQRTVNDLSDMLIQHGYRMGSGTEGDARLSTLRSVTGDGFFYINTHGGSAKLLGGKGGEKIYSIQSSTLASPELERMPDVIEDIKARRLTVITAQNGSYTKNIWREEVPVRDTRYGITSQFVLQYWQFEPGAVVMINACFSGTQGAPTEATEFINACHSKGAGVYLGWTGVASVIGVHKASRYFVDRVLGANYIEPESPYQRAFPTGDVMGDMKRTGHNIDPETQSEFVAFSNPQQGNPQILLAPSIHHLVIDEVRGQLKLVGHFGSEPASVRRVEVAGHASREISWSPEEIVCELPASGDGSNGSVRVWVRERHSNVRHISEWRLQVNYLGVDPSMVGPKLEGKATIRLRADVGPHREQPGTEPTKPVRTAMAARDSKLEVQASGEMLEDCGATSWHGSQTYLALTNPGVNKALLAALRADTATGEGWLGWSVGTFAPDFTQTDCRGSQPIGIIPSQLESFEPFPLPDNSTNVLSLPALHFTFGPGFTIPARHFISESGEVELSWSSTQPLSPPLPGDGV